MPTPPLSEALLLEAIEARQNFSTLSEAANSLGLNVNTFRSRLRVAEASGLYLSEGARKSALSAKLNYAEAKSGWIVEVDPDTGSRRSTYWQAQPLPPETLIDLIESSFSKIQVSDPIQPPKQTADNLCTVYPLMDVHYGMRAWGKETGSTDYDTDIAKDQLLKAFSKIDVLTPSSNTAILIIGGDFFHADDNKAETPASKHKLDVDGRHWRVLDTGIEIVITIIETLAKKHQNLKVRVLRGNHDEHSHLVLTFALCQRYSGHDRIEIERTPRDLFMHQWGKVSIFAHHGDRIKPQQAALYISDVCPFWSATSHRYMLTGHVHHDQAKDIGPLRWESLRAFAPPDAYAASMGYGARRALQSITFDAEDGMVLRAIDPIQCITP